MAQYPPNFFNGNVMLPISLVQSWIDTVDVILPLTSGVLESQFNATVAELMALLAATPPPQPVIRAGEIIIPIQPISDLIGEFNTFQYQYGGPYATNEYQDAVTILNDVFDQYS